MKELRLIIRTTTRRMSRHHTMRRQNRLLRNTTKPSTNQNSTFSLPIQITRRHMRQKSTPQIRITNTMTFRTISIPSLPSLTTRRISRHNTKHRHTPNPIGVIIHLYHLTIIRNTSRTNRNQPRHTLKTPCIHIRKRTTIIQTRLLTIRRHISTFRLIISISNINICHTFSNRRTRRRLIRTIIMFSNNNFSNNRLQGTFRLILMVPMIIRTNNSHVIATHVRLSVNTRPHLSNNTNQYHAAFRRKSTHLRILTSTNSSAINRNVPLDRALQHPHTSSRINTNHHVPRAKRALLV